MQTNMSANDTEPNLLPHRIGEHSSPQLRESLAALKAKQTLCVIQRGQRIEIRKARGQQYDIFLQPETPTFWRNFKLTSAKPIDLETMFAVVDNIERDESDWAHAIDWRALRKPHQGIITGAIAFTVFAIPYLLFAVYAHRNALPGVESKTLVLGFAAITAVALYITWLDFFFGPIRARAAKWAGRLVGGEVTESYGLAAGTWQLEASNPDKKEHSFVEHLLIGGIDVVVILCGTLLPVAAVAISLYWHFAK
jgi:hypothetical protein